MAKKKPTKKKVSKKSATPRTKKKLATVAPLPQPIEQVNEPVLVHVEALERIADSLERIAALVAVATAESKREPAKKKVSKKSVEPKGDALGESTVADAVDLTGPGASPSQKATLEATVEDAKVALKAVYQAKGGEEARALLNLFSVNRVSELDASRYAEFVEASQEALV